MQAPSTTLLNAYSACIFASSFGVLQEFVGATTQKVMEGGNVVVTVGLAVVTVGLAGAYEVVEVADVGFAVV